MPHRTCVACRNKGNVNIFFRILIGPEENIVYELGSKLPGRGAHCCFNSSCISRLISSDRLEIALKRRDFRIDSEELIRNLRMLLGQNLKGMLIASQRKGVLTLGKEAVFKKIKLSNIGKPFASKDISSKVLMNLKRVAEEFYILPFDMSELGRLLSRKPIGVLFIEDTLLVDGICLRLMQERAIGCD